MEWKLRPAVREDDGAVKALFIEMLQTIYAREDVTGYDEDALDPYFDGGEDRLLVADSPEGVVAFLGIEVHHDPRDYLYLDDLSVTAAWRNRGIGTALIAAAEAYAAELHIPAVILHVEKSNTSAFRLYERLGFSVLADEGTRYRLIKTL